MKLMNEKIMKLVFAIIAVSVVVLFFGFYSLIQTKLKAIQDEEIKQYISTVEASVKSVYDFTRDYEAAINKGTYELAKNIRFELESKTYDEIGYDELERLRNEYEVADLSIFVPDGSAYRIVASTDKAEVNSDTEGWGYWNKTFDEIMAGIKISTEKGEAFGKSFWIGPRTRSYTKPGYFRYAYILSADKKYLIDVSVSDNPVDKYAYSGHLESILGNIKRNVESVDAIAIINPSRWGTAIKNRDNRSNDPYVVYGSFNSSWLFSSGATPEKVAEKKMLVYDTNMKGGKLILYSIDNNNILAMRVNSNLMFGIMDALKYVFGALAVMTIIVVTVTTYFLIKKYSGIIELEKKRNEIAKALRKTIVELPDIFYHCRIEDDGAMYVTYNDGKNFGDTCRILDYSHKRKMSEVFSPDYALSVGKLLGDAFEGKRARFEFEYEGHVYDHLASPLIDLGTDANTGMFREVLVMATDITERAENEKRIEMIARLDSLTGIPNRLSFKEHVEKRMAVLDSSGAASMLYMDLNDFKSINDIYGHKTGDFVLCEVARSLMSLSDESVFFARLGGDEFVGWVEGLVHEDTKGLISSIKNMMREKSISDGTNSVNVSVSVGLAAYTGAESYSELMDAADKAMYTEKRS